MFHEGQINNRINCFQDRASGMICEDTNSSFNALLEKDVPFSVHDRNI